MADQHQGSDEAAPWLALSDAASRLGVSVDALRSRIRRGSLRARRGNDNRLFVQVPVNLRLVGDEDSDEARQVDDQSDLVAELQHEIGDLRERLARAEERARAAEEAAAVKVAAKNDLIAELKAMLAEARQPWWRRWIR